MRGFLSIRQKRNGGSEREREYFVLEEIKPTSVLYKKLRKIVSMSNDFFFQELTLNSCLFRSLSYSSGLFSSCVSSYNTDISLLLIFVPPLTVSRKYMLQRLPKDTKIFRISSVFHELNSGLQKWFRKLGTLREISLCLEISGQTRARDHSLFVLFFRLISLTLLKVSY